MKSKLAIVLAVIIGFAATSIVFAQEEKAAVANTEVSENAEVVENAADNAVMENATANEEAPANAEAPAPATY